MLAEIHGSRIVAVHANEMLVGRAAGAPVLADDPDIREKLKSQVEELCAADSMPRWRSAPALNPSQRSWSMRQKTSMPT